MIEGALTAKRGYVYEFKPKSDYRGKCYCLVVSSNARCRSNIVSIVILSQNPGSKEVMLENKLFEEPKYVNVGKVTCTERDRLLTECFKLPDDVMKQVDLSLADCLGLLPDDMAAENTLYKNLYEELIEKIIEKENKDYDRE